MTIKDIQPDEYYSAAAIVDMRLPGFPWRSKYTFNKKLNDERWFDTFKPLIEQHDTTKTYKIQGKNIISFIKDLERGEIKI